MGRTKRVLAAAIALIVSLCVVGCGHAGDTGDAQSTPPQESPTQLVEDFRNTDLGNGWEPTESTELSYAQCFTLDTYEGGYRLACLADGGRYLMVPEGAPEPEGLSDDIVVIERPVGDIYLAASDSMCLFEALDALDRITVSGIERDDWGIEAARAAMDAGDIVYGGKYRAPDYELLLDRGVRLAIESTMINHTPEVREKLIELGIPVITELSSYEPEPLGRSEWIKLYGALCGKDELAAQAFEEQVSLVSGLDAAPTDTTVAFFYLNSNGAAVVRRPGDYVTKMIGQAGGTYVFDELDEAKAGSSTLTLQMEDFYEGAKDADVIIYNSSIDESVESLDDLVQKNELLEDFAAVREGKVWITEQNMYQQMMRTGTIIHDLNCVFTGADEDLTYLRRL